jgi:hypothetical protein
MNLQTKGDNFLTEKECVTERYDVVREQYDVVRERYDVVLKYNSG